MLNKVLLGLTILLVIVVGWLSFKEWDNYKTEQQANLDRIASEQAEVRTEDFVAQEEARLAQEKLVADCALGVEAYGMLTPAQQKVLQQPTCKLEILE
jgi:hypothetical protein